MTADLEERLGPADLEDRLGYRFRRPELLHEALTHRSAAHEQGEDRHYERLEFLGDSVLGLVTADWLYRRYPDSREGQLAALKSHLVSAAVLARFARTLDLGAALLLGAGEARSGGRAKRSLLADALEALFGAIYLDGGLEAVRPLVIRFLEVSLDERRDVEDRESRTRLQEWLQAKKRPLPEYVLRLAEGPDHERLFHFECWVEGRLVGCGSGGSKKAAQRRAAHAALAALEAEEEPGATTTAVDQPS